MEFLVVFLSFLILVLVVSLMQLQKKNKIQENEISRLRKKFSDELAYPQFIQEIIKHPDPFVELLRFSHLSQKNISSNDLSSLLNFFFEELANRGKLEMIGQYKAVVKFSDHPELWERWCAIFRSNAMFTRRTGPKIAKIYFNLKKNTLLEGTEVLWPEWDSYYDLMVLRETEGDIYFQREKQNTPLDPKQCIFKKENMHIGNSFHSITPSFSKLLS